MKVVLIIRDINENFKFSSSKAKIANSTEHLKTENLEEGIKEFNNLKVASEMYMIDLTSKNKPSYYLAATKAILFEKNNKRLLRTSIINPEVLNGIKEKVIDGNENVDLFI